MATFIASLTATGGPGAPSVTPGDSTRSPPASAPTFTSATCPPKKHMLLENIPTVETPFMLTQWHYLILDLNQITLTQLQTLPLLATKT
eukprot:2141638-Ditylum_brightwellii.AAC.1